LPSLQLAIQLSATVGATNMSRRSTSLALAVFAAAAAFSGAAGAADRPVLRKAPAVVSPAECVARCGKLVVTRVRHKQLAMSYGPYFDPRQRDEPRYYWGPVRSFPRYQTVYPAR
jgi:hypothetical protein